MPCLPFLLCIPFSMSQCVENLDPPPEEAVHALVASHGLSTSEMDAHTMGTQRILQLVPRYIGILDALPNF